MSKTKLKKELSGLDKSQLIELILDLYGARKEAKDYFEFFINPDVPKLYESYRSKIEKEMGRGKYGKSTARISKIKTFIKDFASYGIEAESVSELMLYALALSLTVERRKYVSTTFLNGMARLANDLLIYADKNSIFDTVHRRMSDTLDGTVGAKSYVNFLRQSLDWSKI